jgi:hypothetical protein
MLALGAGAVMTAFAMLSNASLRGAQNPAPPGNGTALPAPVAVNTKEAAPVVTPPTKPPENPDLEKARSDAAELSTLASQLRDELNKLRFDVLALDVIQKTEKVEKLAKKIKGEASGEVKVNSQRPQPTP